MCNYDLIGIQLFHLRAIANHKDCHLKCKYYMWLLIDESGEPLFYVGVYILSSWLNLLWSNLILRMSFWMSTLNYKSFPYTTQYRWTFLKSDQVRPHYGKCPVLCLEIDEQTNCKEQYNENPKTNVKIRARTHSVGPLSILLMPSFCGNPSPTDKRETLMCTTTAEGRGRGGGLDEWGLLHHSSMDVPISSTTNRWEREGVGGLSLPLIFTIQASVPCVTIRLRCVGTKVRKPKCFLFLILFASFDTIEYIAPTSFGHPNQILGDVRMFVVQEYQCPNVLERLLDLWTYYRPNFIVWFLSWDVEL